MTRQEVLDLFVANAAKAAAEPVLVADDTEMNNVVNDLVKGHESVFLSPLTEKEKIVHIPDGIRSEDFKTASACIDEVFAGVAETGSIVNSGSNGRLVQAGLLAGHHIALLSKERIFAGLDEFFETCANALPTNMAFETGPSRTADIELTLTIGVHGPGRLTIILY